MQINEDRLREHIALQLTEAKDEKETKTWTNGMNGQQIKKKEEEITNDLFYFISPVT